MGGVRAVAFALASGIAIGISVAWALADPQIAVLVFGAAGIVMALLAIGALWSAIRRRAAKAAFDAASELGRELRHRVLNDPKTLPPKEDTEFFYGLVNTWNHDTQNLIHKYADDWHQTFIAWPESGATYSGTKLWRSRLAVVLDAKLTALAEIRTKL